MNARLRSQAAMAAISVCIVVLTAFYYIFPEHRMIFVGIGVVGVIGIVLGILLNDPAHRLPWILLAIGNFAFAAGQATQIILIGLLQEEIPFPSIADGFYLAAYPLYAAGLLGFVHWRTSWRDRASLVDALTLTVGLALLSWLFLIDPYARVEGLTWVQKASPSPIRSVTSSSWRCCCACSSAVAARAARSCSSLRAPSACSPPTCFTA